MNDEATIEAMQQDSYSLLMRGLINALPPIGNEWSQADQQRWIKLAEAIFGLIYKKR